MVNTIKFLILILLISLSSGQSLASVSEELQRFGKGQAYYLKFIKVYDATLYGEALAAHEDILDAHISKCLHLEYAVGIEKEDFIIAADTVLQRQFSSEQLSQVSTELKVLHDGYEDVEKGDCYTLCYKKDTETTSLALNGKEVVSVTSSEFAKVYFSIWLSSFEPLDKRLRNNLLTAVDEQ